MFCRVIKLNNERKKLKISVFDVYNNCREVIILQYDHQTIYYECRIYIGLRYCYIFLNKVVNITYLGFKETSDRFMSFYYYFLH